MEVIRKYLVDAKRVRKEEHKEKIRVEEVMLK
jgi:hypothetical protein